MRGDTKTDPNNVDKIGSIENPGLRRNQLTKAEHRDRLSGQYRTRAHLLEEFLDDLYGPGQGASRSCPVRVAPNAAS